jgi:tetratricopeptide (TPR) repeat protein
MAIDNNTNATAWQPSAACFTPEYQCTIPNMMFQLASILQSFSVVWENTEQDKALPSKNEQEDTDDVTTSGSTISSLTMPDWDESDDDIITQEESNATFVFVDSCEESSTASYVPYGRVCSSLPARPKVNHSKKHRRRHTAPDLTSRPITLEEMEDIVKNDRAKNNALLAHTWNCIGECYYRDGQYQQARSAFQQNIDCVESNGAQVAIAYAGLAKVFLEIGNIQNSVDYCVRALDAHNQFHETQRRDGTWSLSFAAMHHTLGVACTEMGEFDQAMVSLHKARFIRERANASPSDIVRTMNAIGTLCRKQNEYRSSKLIHEEALQLLDSASNIDEDMADTLCCLGATFAAQNNVDAAISAYKCAIQFQKNCLLHTNNNKNVRRKTAKALMSLGDLFIANMRDPIGAVNAYSTAKKISEDPSLENISAVRLSLQAKLRALDCI